MDLIRFILLGIICLFFEFIQFVYYELCRILNNEPKDKEIYNYPEYDSIDDVEDIQYKLNDNPYIPYDEYLEYLKSDEFKKLKFSRFFYDNGLCQQCLKQLTIYNSHCHHLSYIRLKRENILLDLVTVCPECHEEIHEYHGKNAINYPILKGL